MLSHPAWGEWIEIEPVVRAEYRRMSHPAWGEWIEIQDAVDDAADAVVSPRMG